MEIEFFHLPKISMISEYSWKKSSRYLIYVNDQKVSKNKRWKKLLCSCRMNRMKLFDENRRKTLGKTNNIVPNYEKNYK